MRVFVSTNPCPYPIKISINRSGQPWTPKVEQRHSGGEDVFGGFLARPVRWTWVIHDGVALPTLVNPRKLRDSADLRVFGCWLLEDVEKKWEKWLSKDVKRQLHLGFDHVRPICGSQLHVILVEIVWLDVYMYIYIFLIYDCKAYTWCLRVPTYIHMRYLWPLIMTLVWMTWAWWTHPVRHQTILPSLGPSRWRFIALHGLISGLPIGWHSVYVRRVAITVSQVLTWKGRWLGNSVAEHGDFQNV